MFMHTTSSANEIIDKHMKHTWKQKCSCVHILTETKSLLTEAHATERSFFSPDA